jgi:hypothetical protein
VLDACTEPTAIETITHLVLVVAMQLAPQKGGDVSRFDGLNQGFYELWIEALQCRLVAKDDVGCVLRLHDAPVVAHLQGGHCRTVGCRISVQTGMQRLNIERLRQRVGLCKIGNRQKCIVSHLKVDLLTAQLIGQHVVPVAIELESKRRPGGDAQIAQPQRLIDKVEVVVETFALRHSDIRFSSAFVVPGLIRLARFHCRKNVHQSWVSAPCLHDGLNAIFLAKALVLRDELDLDPGSSSDCGSILANRITQRFGKLGVVEDANPLHVQIFRHPFGITDRRKLATDDDAVVAIQHTGDIGCVSFCDQGLRHLVTSLLAWLKDTLPQLAPMRASTTCLVLALPG